MRVALTTLACVAVGMWLVSGITAHEQACNPNNGIGPDGGLPTLPKPTAPGARFVDLPQNVAPVDVAIDRSAGRVFVALRGTNEVAVIDGKANPTRVLATVRVGARPEALVFDARSRRLFVANGAACSVSVLDVRQAKPRVLATLPAASGPRDLALDQRTGYVYVANFTGGSIRVIDGRAPKPALVGASLGVGPDHVGVVFERKSRRVALLTSRGRLQLFSLAQGKATPAGVVSVARPVDAAGDDRGFVYVAEADGATVTKIDVAKRAKVKTSPTLGAQLFDIVYHPDSNRLILATFSGVVVLVDAKTLAPAGTVRSTPVLAAAAVDSGTCRLWMVEYTHHRVWSVPYKGRCAR